MICWNLILDALYVGLCYKKIYKSIIKKNIKMDTNKMLSYLM